MLTLEKIRMDLQMALANDPSDQGLAKAMEKAMADLARMQCEIELELEYHATGTIRLPSSDL